MEVKYIITRPTIKHILIDNEQLTRHFVVIQWNNTNENLKHHFIRDIIKIQYSLIVKVLKCVDFKYVAQKSPTSEKSTDINTAGVLIEPLNNDIEKYVELIPISQKIPLNTRYVLEGKISYEPTETRKFISSNKIKCLNDSVHEKILKNCHICAMEIGSEIRAKYVVSLTNHNTDGSTLKLFDFMRDVDDRTFTIHIWNYWDVSPKELFEMLINYINNEYVEPKINTNDANDYGANLLYKNETLKVLNEILTKLPSTPTEGSIDKI